MTSARDNTTQTMDRGTSSGANALQLSPPLLILQELGCLRSFRVIQPARGRRLCCISLGLEPGEALQLTARELGRRRGGVNKRGRRLCLRRDLRLCCKLGGLVGGSLLRPCCSSFCLRIGC